MITFQALEVMCTICKDTTDSEIFPCKKMRGHSVRLQLKE